MEDGEIKQSWNIYLYYWTGFAFILFVLINYLSPQITIPSLNLGLMISSVSFLFGFLITITFSLLLARVSILKASLSEETGRLVSLFLLSKKLGSKFSEKMRELIDKYTMITLKEYTNYEFSREFNYEFYDASSLMEIKTKTQEAAAGSFFYILGEFQPVREKLESVTASRTEWSLKFTNYVLGAILIGLLFLNRGDSFTNALFIILSTTVIFIFLIIEDYDNLKIGDYTYNISNSEQVFDLIEKERYYPKKIINRAKLETGKFYRVGFIDGETKKETIFTVKYNPVKFDLKISRLSNLMNKKSEEKLGDVV